MRTFSPPNILSSQFVAHIVLRIVAKPRAQSEVVNDVPHRWKVSYLLWSTMVRLWIQERPDLRIVWLIIICYEQWLLLASRPAMCVLDHRSESFGIPVHSDKSCICHLWTCMIFCRRRSSWWELLETLVFSPTCRDFLLDLSTGGPPSRILRYNKSNFKNITALKGRLIDLKIWSTSTKTRNSYMTDC